MNGTPVAEREVVLTRVFDAPRELVWAAFTEAQHLAKWWGPHCFTNPVCKLDVRPGGTLYIEMQGPDGDSHPMTGVFHEVVKPERLVFTAVVPNPAGGSILEGVNTITFVNQGGKTHLTIHSTAAGFVEGAVQMLEGMEAGWTQSLEKLGELLSLA